MSRSRQFAVCVVILLAVAAATGTATGTATAAPVAASVPPHGYLRVDQVGYLPGTVTVALMTDRTVRQAGVELVDDRGRVVATARTGASRGAWSPGFPAVYSVAFPSVLATGSYSVRVTDGVVARPMPVRVAGGAELYDAALRATVSFLTMQRDGSDVLPGALDRQPAHLTDRSATVYAPPTYDQNNVLQGNLVPVGGPVDVSGGWFDAGDYIKLVQTASYTDSLLLLAARLHPGEHTLAAEAGHGLDWLGKMWDDRTATLYYQVGIGDGDWPRIAGDHDVWRLPQADDALTVAPGDPSYFLKYRPVFRAGPPGSPVSPNLAGRLGACFALAAQSLARTQPTQAARWLARARHVLALANTRPHQLLTASPYDYYPEVSWRDDLQLGWTELAAADRAIGRPAGADLAAAARWAADRLRSSEPRDTLNLYDVSALADAELLQQLRGRADLGVHPAQLRADLAGQLAAASALAGGDPFGFGHSYSAGDPVPHAFGLASTALLAGATGRTAAMARDQAHWALGANAWGTTFVIGVGSVFPHCPQDQIANLSGSLDGTPPLHAGGVTDGPAVLGTFSGLGIPAGARPCHVGGYSRFTGHGVRYVDDVRSWPSVEPADDYTATALLDFALASTS